MLLANRDERDVVVAAALLHDALEDTDVPADEVERRFGTAVRTTAMTGLAARRAALLKRQRPREKRSGA